MGPSDIDESFQSLFSCKLCSADGEVFEDFNTHLKSRDHLERVSHITLASLYQLHEHKILFLSLPSYVFLSNLNPKLPFFFSVKQELCKQRRPPLKRKMEKPDFNVSEYNNCWGQNRLRRNQCLKVPRKYLPQ